MKMLKVLFATAIALASFSLAHAATPPKDDPFLLKQMMPYQKLQDRFSTEPVRIKSVQVAQNATTSIDTTTRTKTEPTSVTTTVKGGSIAAQILEWVQLVFGTAAGLAFLWVVQKGLALMGIKTTTEQRAQLQSIIVNGLNAAAEKAKENLRGNDKLDIHIKSQIVADAVDYTQRHAAETIKALGLDPKSGEAVMAIRARIETALNDPSQPTPPEMSPAKPAVSGVTVEGKKV